MLYGVVVGEWRGGMLGWSGWDECALVLCAFQRAVGILNTYFFTPCAVAAKRLSSSVGIASGRRTEKKPVRTYIYMRQSVGGWLVRLEDGRMVLTSHTYI